MADIVMTPGNEGPVNDGERRVLEHLAANLPNSFTLYPNLQVSTGLGQLAECDIIVLGPDCLWIVEVKDLAGTVEVQENAFYVNGEIRGHAVHQTRVKAQKIKSRIASDPVLAPTWVQPIVILARKPASLQVAHSMNAFITQLDRATDAILDPALVGLERDRVSAVMRQRLVTRLSLDAVTRVERPMFGAYRGVEKLSQGVDRVWWSARHDVMGTPVLLEVIEVSPLLSPEEQQRRRHEAYRAARVRARTGPFPWLLTPETAFNRDDGSVVVVHPNSGDRALVDLVDEIDKKDEQARRRILGRVAQAVHYCHSRNVIHRTIGPSSVFVDGQGNGKLGGFTRASFLGAAGATVSPADWGALGGQFWMAPEHTGGVVGPEADLFALGMLIRTLWPHGAPTELEEAAGKLLAERPDERACTAKELADLALPQPAVVAPPPPPITFEVGALLENRYKVIEQVGAGGSGTVWHALDTIADKHVALKVYDSLDAGNQAIREYNALLDVHHPNVVKVRGAQEIEGRWVLVSEFLDGPTLRGAMPPAATAPTVEEAVTLVMHLLGALQSIHPDVERILTLTAKQTRTDAEESELQALPRNGLVHRDIKPENIILAAPDRPVLIDFGLAASGGDAEAGGSRAYCPAGAAVEGSDPDRDLFALGVILHELLTGSHPYSESDPLAGDLEIDESLPPELRAVLQRACSPSYSERFRSAHRFVEALVALGLAEVPFELPAAGGLDLMQAIKKAVFDRRWDDAEQLCPATWTVVAEKIARMRRLDEKARPTPPLIEIDGFTLRFLEERPFRTATDPGNQEYGPGVHRVYLAEGPAGEMRAGRDSRAAAREPRVPGGDSFDTKRPLSRLSQGLRIGSKKIGGGLLIELRQARLTKDDWSAAFKADRSELASGAGVDVEATLLAHGASAVGTRAELIDDTSARRFIMALVMPEDAVDTPAVAFFLTRVMPLVKGMAAESGE